MLNKIIKLFTGVWLSQEYYKKDLDFASRNGQIWVLNNVKAEIKTACTDNYGNEKDISYEHIAYIIDKYINREV